MRHLASLLRRPGVLLGTLALVLAISSSAVALPGKNKVDKDDLRQDVVKSNNILNSSIGSMDLADNSVRETDIADEAVTAANIKDNSVGTDDVANDSLTGADIQESSLKGLMSGQVRYVLNDSAPLNNNVGSQITALCPSGERAIGGGGGWMIPTLSNGDLPTAQQAPITASMPATPRPGITDTSGWTVAGRNMTGSARILRAYAICVAKA